MVDGARRVIHKSVGPSAEMTKTVQHSKNIHSLIKYSHKSIWLYMHILLNNVYD